ncbi:MAG TPA: nuclear transport factor 2 family protein [Solirubrobacteraceae bacterium]|nr:nuclear transport factor 2 family protein [Solirubrobacteraceae bacterium]
MSQENVELVRESLERFVATGEPAWDMLDEEIEVHDHDIVDAGEYRGLAGVERWFEDWAAAWSEFSMEPEAFIDAGERVIAVVRMKATGRGSGVSVDRQDAMVWEIGPDRRLVRVDYFNNRQQALKSVGLAD